MELNINTGPDLPQHFQTTLEEADYSARQNNEERRVARHQKSRYGQMALMAASYIPLGFAADNISYITSDRDTLAPVIEGCESPDLHNLPDLRWEPSEALTHELGNIELNSSSVRSSAADFRPLSRASNSADRAKDILLVPWNFDHQIDVFTMRQSGINIEVYTNDADSNIGVNRRAIEAIFNEPMERWYIFSDKSTRDFYYCAKKSILNGQESAGTTIKIILPSEPNYCIRGMHAVAIGDDSEKTDTCVTSGFNFPNLDFGVLDDVLDPHIVFATGGVTDSEVANFMITRRLVHELAGHQIVRIMETKPLLNRDEAFALITARQLLAARAVELEQPFVYSE